MDKLSELINSYAEEKAQLDDLKKEVDIKNAEIKAQMLESGKSTVETDTYVAKRTVSKKETMNEDKLLAICHNKGLTDLIKTREYVDMDKLESAIYNGELSKDILMCIANCKESKDVVTLRVVKRKEKKNETEA